jgi:hypothetical protein
MRTTSIRIAVVSLACTLGLLAAAREACADSQADLYAGFYLFPGQSLLAPSCYFETTMQSDGNLVTNNGWWSSGTANRGAYAVFQTDGNFVIYNWSDQAVWATNTFSGDASGEEVVQQDDGNLVLYDPNMHAVWASGHYGEALGSTPCERTGAKTRMVANMHFSGTVYETLTLSQPRPSWCAYFCAEDTKCASFNYAPIGATCTLYSSAPNPTQMTGSYAGYVDPVRW